MNSTQQVVLQSKIFERQNDLDCLGGLEYQFLINVANICRHYAAQEFNMSVFCWSVRCGTYPNGRFIERGGGGVKGWSGTKFYARYRASHLAAAATHPSLKRGSSDRI
jgi:hypothetical protein